MFIWDVQTLTIVYMTFVVNGQYLWLCIYSYVYGCVYGHVFMDLGFWMCLGMCFWLSVWMCLGMCFWLCVWLSGLDPPRGPVQQYRGFPLFGARFHHHWDLLLHEAHFSRFWDLLLHEAHSSKSWVLLLHEAHLDDSPNFSTFSLTKMEKFAPVCSVE